MNDKKFRRRKTTITSFRVLIIPVAVVVLAVSFAVGPLLSVSSSIAYAQTSDVTVNLECIVDEDGSAVLNYRIDNINSIKPDTGAYGFVFLRGDRLYGGQLIGATPSGEFVEPISGTLPGVLGEEFTLQAVVNDELTFNSLEVVASESATCPPHPPAPLAVTISADPTSGDAPLTVDFTASATGGTPPYSYRWDFGDGNTVEGTQPTASHTYQSPEAYTATVTVTDANGQEASATVEVNVNEPPEPEKTPVEQIADLRNTINNMDISDRLKQTLQAPLTNIEKILTDEDPSNDADACEKLAGFIGSVNGKTGTPGGLTTEQAEELISQAEAIQEDLGC